MTNHILPPASTTHMVGSRQRTLSLTARIVTWAKRRRARLDLARLDDHMLADIGLDRSAAASEAARPFWQD